MKTASPGQRKPSEMRFAEGRGQSGRAQILRALNVIREYDANIVCIAGWIFRPMAKMNSFGGCIFAESGNNR